MNRVRGLLVAVLLLGALEAQAIKDKDNQGRWGKPVEKGPDKDVPGFLVNLGPTGARAVLTDKTFIVRYIFPGSPAVERLRLGDVVTGAFGKPFSSHTFGGNPHGYEGPIMDLGNAIEEAEWKDGKLKLAVRRGGEPREVVIPLEPIGRFSPTFPMNCRKSSVLRRRALKYLASDPEAVKGPPHSRSMAILALLTSGDKSQEAIGKRAVLAWNSIPGPEAWTWPIAYQLITVAEYHLLTGDDSVLDTIRKLSTRLRQNQYDGRGSRIIVWDSTKDPRVMDSQQLYRGGFGHGPYTPGVGKNGYGPMQYTTILALIAWQLAERCGIKTDPLGKKYALEFIHRGTNEAGYVAYGGEFTLNNGYIDPVRWKASTRGENYVGRSGASLIAHKLSPEFADSAEYIRKNREYLLHAQKSLPDGHACSVLGFAWGLFGVGAAEDEKTFRAMFDYHKAWFNMMRCHDGSFVVQPGRDYADGGYYISSRYNPTAVMALALGLAYPKLQIQGIEVGIPGINPKTLSGPLLAAYRAVVAKSFGKAAKLAEGAGPKGAPIKSFLEAQTRKVIDSLKKLETSGQWVRLEEQIAELRPFYAGVPIYDTAVAAWNARLKGSPLLAADKLHLAGQHGKAFITLGAAEGPEAKALQSRILAAADKVVARWDALRNDGAWHALKTDLDSVKSRYKGIEIVDRRAEALASEFTSADGRALIEADEKLSAGQAGPAVKALGEVTTAPANALRARVKKLEAEVVASLEGLEEEGRWNTLKTRLSKERSKMAGLETFAERATKWDAFLKTGDGRSAVSAERYYDQGKLGLAMKGAAPALRKRIEDQVNGELTSLEALETKGDVHALKLSLSRLGRKLRGVPSFDEREKAWLASFRKEPARTALRHGAVFVRLRDAAQRKPSSALKRQIQAFAAQAGDSFYGKEAQKLLQGMRQ